MRGWIDLPVEIRHKCINRMSILSSMSLRQCSKYDQQVVDSMHLNIPRIRIAEKRERVLIVVYTGVQTFLRMEFRKGDKHNETVMFSSENTIENPQIKRIPYKKPKHIIKKFLKWLLKTHRKVNINTIEWEFHMESKYEWNRLGMLGKLKISPYRIVGSFTESAIDFPTFIMTRLDGKVSTNGEFSMRNPIPQTIVFSVGRIVYPNGWISKEDKIEVEFGRYSRNVPEVVGSLYDLNKLEGDMKAIVSFPLIKDVQLEIVRQVLNKVDEKKMDGVVVERFSFCDDREAIVCSSPCGVWAQLVEIGQNHFKLDNFSCGMGIGCKIHEPFEYWYHSQLPRRLVEEPFWSGVVYNLNESYYTRNEGLTIKDIKDDHQGEFTPLSQEKVDEARDRHFQIAQKGMRVRIAKDRIMAEEWKEMMEDYEEHKHELNDYLEQNKPKYEDYSSDEDNEEPEEKEEEEEEEEEKVINLLQAFKLWLLVFTVLVVIYSMFIFFLI